MISMEYIVAALVRGVTVDELATELEITPRHVRRLAKAGGWTPPPRKHSGPRTLKIGVSPETYAALAARGGKSVEDTAGLLLKLTADAPELQRRIERAEQGRVDDARGGHWAAGYLEQLVEEIKRAR
jgi:hypothetical protein